MSGKQNKREKMSKRNPRGNKHGGRKSKQRGKNTKVIPLKDETTKKNNNFTKKAR